MFKKQNYDITSFFKSKGVKIVNQDVLNQSPDTKQIDWWLVVRLVLFAIIVVVGIALIPQLVNYLTELLKPHL